MKENRPTNQRSEQDSPAGVGPPAPINYYAKHHTKRKKKGSSERVELTGFPLFPAYLYTYFI